MRYVLGLMVGAGALLSCLVANAASLAGSEWGIENNQEFFIKFSSEGKLSGNAGCNSFFGSYEIKGNKLFTSKIGATRKMCLPIDMEIENKFLNLLATDVVFMRDGHRLELFDTGNVSVFKLQQRDWD